MDLVSSGNPSCFGPHGVRPHRVRPHLVRKSGSPEVLRERKLIHHGCSNYGCRKAVAICSVYVTLNKMAPTFLQLINKHTYKKIIIDQAGLQDFRTSGLQDAMKISGRKNSGLPDYLTQSTPCRVQKRAMGQRSQRGFCRRQQSRPKRII